LNGLVDDSMGFEEYERKLRASLDGEVEDRTASA
jgi:hypothetical protein